MVLLDINSLESFHIQLVKILKQQQIFTGEFFLPINILNAT